MSRRLQQLLEEETDSDSDLEYEPVIRRPRRIMIRHNFMERYDDSEFAIRFRLSKESVLALLAKIQHNLEYISDR